MTFDRRRHKPREDGLYELGGWTWANCPECGDLHVWTDILTVLTMGKHCRHARLIEEFMAANDLDSYSYTDFEADLERLEAWKVA